MDYDKTRLLALGFSEETISQLDFGGPGSGRRREDWIKDRGDRISGNEEEEAARLKWIGSPNRIKTYSNWVKNNPGKFSEGDIATSEMTPNFLPKEPVSGDLKNPRMAEATQRMPRDIVLKKLNDRNGLAMEAAPNFNEDDHDAFHSDEPNGNMIVNNLRVIRDKTDILLGMLDGSKNLPPWCFVKITNAGTGLASVADYLRFGAET